MSDLRYWIALNMIPDVGLLRTRALLAEFATAENIFRAGINEIMSVAGIGEKTARSIVSFRNWDMVDGEIANAAAIGARILAFDDTDYPEGLKVVHGGPIVLYVMGRLVPEDGFAVAMVGSRQSTDYGLRTALKMSAELASAGITIVSGMARGIDTAAHTGALDAGGRTIAVLGSGLDVPYPLSNRALMERIAKSGAVVSEFPLGTKPLRENFPRRNRIITAVSSGVIVVEAALDSGSLITVGYALEQGKDVFAVPGNINSNTSRGTNKLIRSGAVLVENAADVLDELAPQLRAMIRERRKPRHSLTDEEDAVFGLFGEDAVHIDTISRRTGFPAGKTLSILLDLELKGVVRQETGKKFYLT